ncbi:hypothetical protein [Thermococcus sp.]|uniref:hypothetical protein n=1 Tax=Thermococcus sp. TaxID=35749 RepID=UPI0025CFD099|nr:hypothetical protein [Thermococcus sp.]
MIDLDKITEEELLRSVPIFFFVFMGYAFLWQAVNQRIPAVGAPITSLILSLGTVPLRIWYRRRRGW